MVWKLNVATNAAATTFVDRTSIVDRTSLRVGGMAQDTEVDASSGFDVADDAGTVTLPTRRVVTVVEDATTPDTTLFRGRVVSRGVARGTKWDGSAKQYDVMLVDYNADFGGIRISRVGRPAETDHARITYVLNTWLQGTQRASTNLLSTYLQTTSPVNLAKQQYNETTPAGIIQDVIQQTGKECFVTVDGELFYGPSASVVYAAGLSITDVSPNGTTSFAPLEPTGDEDGTEFYSRCLFVYRDRQKVEIVRAAIETAQDQWGFVIVDEAVTTSTEATRRANVYLDAHDHDELRYRCAIQLREDQVHLVKYGQTLSFRSAAVGVLTAVTLRVKRIFWQEAGPGIYFAHLELGFPKTLGPRAGTGGADAGGGFGGGGGGCCDAPAPFIGCPPANYTLSASAGDLACIIDALGEGCLTDDDPGGGRVLLYNACTYRVQYVIDHGPNSNVVSPRMAGTGGSPVLGITDVGSLRLGTNISFAETTITTGGAPGGSQEFEAWLQHTFYVGRSGTGASISATLTYVSGPDPRFDTITCDAVPAVGQPVNNELLAGRASGATFTLNHPYLAGSLKVRVDGVWVLPTEIDPAAGTFSLPFDTTGKNVIVSYLGTATNSTGLHNPTAGATSPVVVAHTHDDLWKTPVRVATVGNIVISTALNAGDTIDGVVLVAGDRVLVRNQAAAPENGIYVAGTTPARAIDMDLAADIMGALVYVVAGTLGGRRVWRNTNTAVPTLGTTPLTFRELIDQQDAGRWELLVADGISNPTDPLMTEDGTDFIYGWVASGSL